MNWLKENIREILKKMAIILAVLVPLYVVVNIIPEPKPKMEDSKDINLPIPAEQLIDEGKNLPDMVGGLVYYPPGVGMYESYTKDAQTYESKLGFSFKYPSYLHVMDMIGNFESGPIVVLPISKKDSDDNYGVVVSVGLNDKNMTPLDWVEGPNSGADLSKTYQKFDLDGQEAIVLDDGAWVVVNTPNNRYRLSIALLPGENHNFLFTEMGIIIDSLRFVQ